MRAIRPSLIRFVGITGLSLLTLVVFFEFVGKTDVSWALPWTKPFRLHWPKLPHFVSWTTTAPDGRAETIYQVPTRQLTKAEIARLFYTPGATNTAAAASPAGSSATSPSGR